MENTIKVASAWSGHDCSFCILEDGYPVVHAEYERYIREKEPAGDGVQFMFDKYKEHEEIKYFATNHSFTKLETHKDSLNKLNAIIKKNNGKMELVGHHQAHAANAFFCSNFDKALIFTMDGGGFESEDGFVTTFTVWEGSDNKISPIKIFPIDEVNIGGVWTRATRYIFGLQSGWPRGHQAGTVMAMAAMGNPERYFQDFYRMLTVNNRAASYKPYNQPRGANVGTDPEHPYLVKWTKLANTSEQETFDLAAGLQKATEVYLKQLLDEFIENYGENNICFAGGVSLNSVIMGNILDLYSDKNIYVTPTPHDGGLTLGAAQFMWHHVLDNPRITWEDNFTPYLGCDHSNSIRNSLETYGDKIKVLNTTDEDVITLLDEQKIIAVYGGGSESGRRALGNRSILADPRSSLMKDMINDKVKHRQWFRPFAPSMLREEVSNWFKKDIESPYMSFVLEFKDSVKNKVPAVVHFDGTARLQTVRLSDNKWYYEFIKKWFEKSGVPILLNTSFNDREPICELPNHAVDCFLNTEIDYLYFYEKGLLVSKNDNWN